MEFGGKSSFSLGLDSKIPRCFLMMRPTSCKFGLNVVTNGNNFFSALARVLSKSVLDVVEAWHFFSTFHLILKALLKNIPLNINKRLTNISSSNEVFDAAIAPYQKALQESGYDHKLTYHPEAQQTRKRKRKRNVTWYNPPWNSNLKTNLGRKLLCIVDKCFPKIHPLHKIFNRHTLKLSYSCMPNMKSTIASHNKTILSNVTPALTQQSRDGCNCRKKNECPLEGHCLQSNVVYQATVTSETSTESYVGLATNFKERYRNHNASFRHANKRNETELSKHIWTLKDAKKAFKIKWRVPKKVPRLQ